MRRIVLAILASCVAAVALAAPSISIDTPGPLTVKVAQLPWTYRACLKVNADLIHCDQWDTKLTNTTVPSWYVNVPVSYSSVDRLCALRFVIDAAPLATYDGASLGTGGFMFGSTAAPQSASRAIQVGQTQYGPSGVPVVTGAYIGHAQLMCAGGSFDSATHITVNVTP